MTGSGDARPFRLWVIGAGGLLGSAVRRAADGGDVFRPGPVPWQEGHAAATALSAQLDAFRAQSGGDRWAVVWAAGAGVIATDPAHLAGEAEVFDLFVRDLARNPPRGEGGFFLASSASVYAGSTGAPFDEASEPVPLNAYGRTKLLQESMAAAALAQRVPFVAGRISTLYGPGQRLDKPQGLISQMCLQAALNRPIPIYVPMDTLRDYLYVDDAAALVHAVLTELVAGRAPTTLVLASQRATTIAELVSVVQQVSRGRIGVTRRLASTQAGHIRDLRVQSRHPLAVTGVPTALHVGVRRVYDAILLAHRSGALSRSVGPAVG